MGKKAKKKAKKPSPTDERYKFLTGLFLLFLALYLVLSFSSFFFTWKADQSFEWGQVVSSAGVTVENWGGKLGARLANLLIAKWFGIASFLLPFFLIVLSFKLFRIRLLPVKKTLQFSLIGVIVLSLILGYLFQDLGGYMVHGPGGGHGLVMARWLNALIGKTGTAFVLIIAVAAIVLALINKPLDEIKRSLVQWMASIVAPLQKQKHHPAMAVAAEQGSSQAREEKDVPGGKQDQKEKLQNHQTQQPTHGEKWKESSSQEESSPQKDTHPAEDVTQWQETSQIAAMQQQAETGNKAEKKNEQEQSQPGTTREDSGVELTIEKTEEEREDGNFSSTMLDDYDPTLELSHFEMPPIELLEDYGDGEGEAEINKEEILRNKNKIVETLGNYKIKIDKIKATVGPTVTLYEIVPAPGIRISKIKNLEDDIALSLAALGIRIIAPIPGKGTIGIEVPNEQKEIVSMRSVLSSKNFREAKYELPIGLGRTISNETYVMDLSRMPHLLVAGATGQGKSVGLNAIITSLLYKKHPAQLKFVMVDPKKVELTLYSKIKNHYMAKIPDIEEPIVTENQDVIKTLNSLCVEMDERYNLLKAAHVRNIKEYNKKFIKKRLNPEKGHRYLPYIVVMIDEFADLIMTAGKEIENPLARLAQLARAIGIHLVIATQRPTTNIITGVIKANFPARIAFRVTSMIDSRTILDSPGANQLIGRGDMLISTGSDLTRLQCAFLETDDLEKITDFISNQQGFAQPFELPEYEDEEGLNGEAKNIDQWDDLFEEAARMVVRHQQGSTSLIQRKFSIGYNRAGRIMDQLEAANIVGPHEGSKARQVLFPDEYALEQYLNASSNKDS